MEKTKLRYEVPEAETFVVRFEGNILQASLHSTNRKNKTEYYIYDDDDYSEL